MANLACWYTTKLPVEIVEIVERDVEQFDRGVEQSQLIGEEVDLDIRNSKNSWVPTDHWIAGWLWYYINKINSENFCYDLLDIDDGKIQYTHYNTGDYYHWHQDADIDCFYKPQIIPGSGSNLREDQTILKGECIRKLSFTLQLSDAIDYRGGEVEFLDNSNNRFLAPKERGSIIVFDSRVRHRVRRIKSGSRKSLVGWCVGPRWK